MKKFIIFIGIVIVIILLLNVAFFIFINVKGKDIVAENLEKNLGVEASIEALSFKFPFGIAIENFKCADISFQKANVFLGLPDPFNFRIIINRVSIEGLKIKITKTKDGVVFLPVPPVDYPAKADDLEKEAPEAEAVKPEKEKELTVTLLSGYIKDAVVEFIDLSDEKPVSFIFENVNLKLRNFTYPKLTKCHIDLKSDLKTDNVSLDKAIAVDGWVDYFHKNMDLNISLNSINYTIFDEYFSSFWKPDNLGIEEAYLSLQSKAKSKNNDLVIDSILSLDSIEFIKDSDDSSNKDLIRTVLALIQGDKDKASLNFKLKTKMDSPELSFSSIKKSFKKSVPMSSIFISGAIDKTKKGVKDVKDLSIDMPTETLKGTLETTIDAFKSIFGSSNDSAK